MKVSIFLIAFAIFFCSNIQYHFYNKNQRAFYECSDPLDYDTTLYKPNKGKVYFSFNLNLKPTIIKSQGFIWYDETILNNYFTGYLINSSDTTFISSLQDGSLIMIQEALDPNGVWCPIEYWVPSGCGNSYDKDLQLGSKKYVMIPIRKYEGPFQTIFRLKFWTGKKIIYSENFRSSISYKQFTKLTKKDKVYGILYRGEPKYLDY